MHYLFSYGTLQLENVQLENYGRLLHGEKDRLPHFILGSLKITDTEVLRKSGREYHPIARRTGNTSDEIEGMVFEITDEELAMSDAYEVSDYKRIAAVCSSGKQVWVYVAQTDAE